MKVIGTIPKKIKPGKHKWHVSFKKVGWPEDHKTVNANKKAKPGETTFNDKFHVLDGSENAECVAEWLKDFDDKILQPLMRKKQSQFKKNAKLYANTDIWDSLYCGLFHQINWWRCSNSSQGDASEHRSSHIYVLQYVLATKS